MILATESDSITQLHADSFHRPRADVPGKYHNMAIIRLRGKSQALRHLAKAEHHEYLLAGMYLLTPN